MGEIKHNLESREALRRGIDILANTVKATLGPKGRNVVIKMAHLSTVTKDGVTVAKQIHLPDKFENTGAQMVKEAAIKTAQQAGDGTTTATVLAQAIVNQGMTNLAAGANPIDLKRGIDMAVTRVVSHIEKTSKPVGKNFEKIRNVATVSANNDAEIGNLIADTMKTIGQDGIIYIEPSRTVKTRVEIIKGMQVNSGYISPYFITDQSKNIAELIKPRILLYDGKLSGIGPLLPILDVLSGKAIPFLIIAEDIDGETLSSLVHNTQSGVLKSCAIKSPFGEYSKELMRDIAAYTGATFISEDAGLKLEDCLLDHLGVCDKVVSNEYFTTIIGGKPEDGVLKTHIRNLRALAKEAPSDHDRDFLKDRIARFSNGIAVLYVGAPTEIEMNEKKDRVDDAVQATRAALEEGIVPGGGLSYLKAIPSLKNLLHDEPHVRTGIDIIRKALEEPFRQICANAGVEGSVVLSRLKSDSDTWGYNARTDTYEDLIAAGVIDPTKVVRVALQNAASVATMILTTSAIITD